MSSGGKYDAVVVGAGPNGLAAGITLAAAGRSVLLVEAKDTVGGGTRTQELTLPGFRHDVCSAAHPLALASPFFRSLDLSVHGLQWIQPPIPLAHPMDDGEAALMRRSLDETAEGLGVDAKNYRRLIGPPLKHWNDLVEGLLKPLSVPAKPLTLTRFGLKAMRSAMGLARSRFEGAKARALFAGNSAHSIFPLEHWSGAGFGLMLCMSGHAVGWPIAKGGSQAIADALASHFVSLGGTVRLGWPVESTRDLPPARAILLALTPRQVADVADSVLPNRYLDGLRRRRYGSGVFKMDWALAAPIPWKDPECLKTATLHLGGTAEEIASAERRVWRGELPERPFTLLNQPSLFDPTRAPDGAHTAWAYCHVPNGCGADLTDRIEAQIERFAPGFRERILARRSMNPADMEAYNANYVGGDIAGGVQSFGRLFVRPLGRWRAYSTPVKGLYICSSSMPPGGGVHGMCGALAARLALKQVLSG